MMHQQYQQVGLGQLGEVIRWGPLGPGGDPAMSLQSWTPGVPVSGLRGLGALQPLAQYSQSNGSMQVSVDAETVRAMAPYLGFVPVGWVVAGVVGAGVAGWFMGRMK